MKAKLQVWCMLLLSSLLCFSCVDREDIDVQVESVRLSSSVLTLVKGDNATLEAVIEPLNVATDKVKWITQDERIATVSEGEVTAVAVGRTSITAVCGGQTAVCVVEVVERQIPIESISFASAEVDMVLGTQTEVMPDITPAQYTDRLEWRSSNEEVATVAGGTVFARALGETTITVRSGDKQASCLVRVKRDDAKVYALSLSESVMKMAVGDVDIVYPQIKADRVQDVVVSWSSSDPNVVAVLNGRLSAKAKGSATITARAGKYEATCRVEVVEKVFSINLLTLNHTQLTIKAKQSQNLIVTIDPEEYLDRVQWSSDNEEVASVSPYGEVLGKKPGVANIKAQVGDKVATCEIEVQAALTEEDFKIEVTNINALDANIKMTPSSDDITYIFDVVPKPTYDDVVARYGSQMEADRKFWDEFGEAAFLEDIKSKTMELKLSEAHATGAPIPGGEYIVYCYGIDKKRRATSPLKTFVFKLKESERVNMQLSFKTEQITPTAIIGEIVSSDPSISYYFTLQRKTYVDSYMKKYEADPNARSKDGVNFRDQMIYSCITSELNNKTFPELLHKGNFKLVDGFFTRKRPNTEYVLIIVGYDMEKGLCTEPVLHHFRTASNN